MPLPAPLIDAALNGLGRSPFAALDVLRRAQGNALGALGLDPDECPYRIAASGRHWRLRRYGDRSGRPPLLIVAAPIKQPYIWDLTPQSSAIRRCLRPRWNLHLLEWLPASLDTGNNGLDDYADAISECIQAISVKAQGARPFLIGHSLGGTLAAIYGAFAPESIRGLVLLGAPLCFQPGTSPFRDALVALVPSTLSGAGPFPGSLLSLLSAVAAPGTFLWSRLADAAGSGADPRALDLHARVERWALDEAPLPGKLVYQIIEWLYRDNRLCRGTLNVGGTLVGPATLSTPTLAVVNMRDDIAPMASIRPFLDAMPTCDVDIIEYPGEAGVCLQHVGILIGRAAHVGIWPRILSWLDGRR